MKFKVGQVWKRRDGREITITSVDDVSVWGNYPIRGEEGINRTSDGWSQSDGPGQMSDLVELVSDPETVSPAEEIGPDQSHEIRIRFDKTYPESTTWHEILLNFLDVLSEEYYPNNKLDEYDLLGIIWEARKIRLHPLVDERNTPALNMFKDACGHAFACYDEGNKLREEYRETLLALMPKEVK